MQQQKKIDFTHYTRLLTDKKYWIILITVFVSIGWYFAAPMLLEKDKLYDFTAIIRFDDPRSSRSASGVDESFSTQEGESKIRIINTTPFLTDVVDSLKLNIQSATSGVKRSEIFESIELQEPLAYGRYTLKKDDHSVNLLYTNKKEEKKDFLLKTFPLQDSGTFEFDVQGIKAVVYYDVLLDRDNVSFICIPTRYVIAGIRSKLNLNLNRRQTLLTINYQNTDPILGTKITNTIVDLFLIRTLEFKRMRTRKALTSLKEQLESSRKELETVESKLRYFRERNPYIYLTENMANFNHELLGSENELNQLQGDIDRLKGLLDDKNRAQGDENVALLYAEIVSFLNARRVPGVTALAEQYRDELRQKEALLAQHYSEDHPQILEINKSIKNIQKKIDKRALQLLKEDEFRAKQLQQNITKSDERLKQSPRKEMQLAKLVREQAAKSQVYSNVLVRYNEVKVADASITSDAYLLEKAEEPIEDENVIDKLLKLAKFFLGPILGIVMGIIIFVGLDFIWHHVRSEVDIENSLNIPVLATIPVIKSDKEVPENFDDSKRMDEKLITIDYSPTPESEAFRNLRTKLILDAEKNKHKSFVVTSLNADEGKSLVTANLAITFAQLKRSTLLIDGDLRRGVQHNSFLLNKKPGLADLLAKPQALTLESITKVIQKTTIPNLYVISSGMAVPNPTEILIGDKLEQLLTLIKQRFQYVIIDTPPIDLIPDSLVFNKFIHDMVFVTRYGKTDLNKLQKRLKEFPEMKKDLQGLVLNASSYRNRKKYYGYSYYKY